MILLCLSILACEDRDLPRINFPEVVTLSGMSSAKPTEAFLEGEIKGLKDDSFVTQHGHLWTSSAGIFTMEENAEGLTTLGREGNQVFSSQVQGLTPGRTYRYRAYLTFEDEVSYGSIHTFVANDLDINLKINNLSCVASFRNATTEASLEIDVPAGILVDRLGIAWGNVPAPILELDQHKALAENAAVNPRFEFAGEFSLSAGVNYVRPYLALSDTIYYGATACCTVADDWLQIEGFPGKERSSAVSFVIGTKAYIGLGEGLLAQIFDDFWTYDSRSNRWERIADFPGQARFGAIAFTIGDRAYVGTGESNTNRFKDMYEYNPELNEWKPIADFKGLPRSYATAFSIGIRGYVGTGVSQTKTNGQLQIETMNDFWEYDQRNNQWIEIDSLPGSPRLESVGFAIDQHGYIAVGRQSLLTTEELKEIWRYDPLNASWTELAPVPSTLGGFASVGFSVNGKALISTGLRNGGFPSSEVWSFDPKDESWTQQAELTGLERTYAVGFGIGDRAFIGAGSTQVVGRPLGDFFSLYVGNGQACPD